MAKKPICKICGALLLGTVSLCEHAEPRSEVRFEAEACIELDDGHEETARRHVKLPRMTYEVVQTSAAASPLVSLGSILKEWQEKAKGKKPFDLSQGGS